MLATNQCQNSDNVLDMKKEREKKNQKYMNKKSPITGYGLHSKFNLKDAAKCGRSLGEVGKLRGERSWGSLGKVYKMFGIGEMTQSNAKDILRKVR